MYNSHCGICIIYKIFMLKTVADVRNLANNHERLFSQTKPVSTHKANLG